MLPTSLHTISSKICATKAQFTNFKFPGNWPKVTEIAIVPVSFRLNVRDLFDSRNDNLFKNSFSMNLSLFQIMKKKYFRALPRFKLIGKLIVESPSKVI